MSDQSVATRSDSTLMLQPDNEFLHMLERLAINPDVDVAKLSALLDMKERVADKQAEREFNAAMVQLQMVLPRVKKNGFVNKTKAGDPAGSGGGYNFATWEDMDTVLRPLMREYGFVLSFNSEPPGREGGGAWVIGTLLHIGGHSREARINLTLDSGAGKNSLQAMGSTLSYGKRYVAEMLFNIVREGADDDATTGGIIYVSAAKAKEIDDLITTTRIDRTAFLQWAEVKSTSEIRLENYTSTLNAIHVKARQMAKAAGQGQST